MIIAKILDVVLIFPSLHVLSSNTNKEVRRRMCGIMGIDYSADPGKYLCYPLIGTKTKVKF